MSAEHGFCRTLYADVMKEVLAKFTREQIKRVWVWKNSFGAWEFHGPNGEYFYGLSCVDCSWSAKAAGWTKLLRPEHESEVES